MVQGGKEKRCLGRGPFGACFSAIHDIQQSIHQKGNGLPLQEIKTEPIQTQDSGKPFAAEDSSLKTDISLFLQPSLSACCACVCLLVNAASLKRLGEIECFSLSKTAKLF